MGCRENFELVDNPDRADWMRKEALCNLARDGCMAELYRLTDNPDRADWIREGALEALCAFAQLGGASLSGTSVAVRFGDVSVTLDCVSVDVSAIGPTAAQYLFELADNPDRADRLRRRATEALASGRWSKHCFALADNPDRADWIRKLAMRGV